MLNTNEQVVTILKSGYLLLYSVITPSYLLLIGYWAYPQNLFCLSINNTTYTKKIKGVDTRYQDNLELIALVYSKVTEQGSNKIVQNQLL